MENSLGAPGTFFVKLLGVLKACTCTKLIARSGFTCSMTYVVHDAWHVRNLLTNKSSIVVGFRGF